MASESTPTGRCNLQEKLAAAVKAAEQFNAEAVEVDERKRKYNAAEANGDAEPTPGASCPKASAAAVALHQRLISLCHWIMLSAVSAYNQPCDLLILPQPSSFQHRHFVYCLQRRWRRTASSARGQTTRWQRWAGQAPRATTWCERLPLAGEAAGIGRFHRCAGAADSCCSSAQSTETFRRECFERVREWFQRTI